MGGLYITASLADKRRGTVSIPLLSRIIGRQTVCLVIGWDLFGEQGIAVIAFEFKRVLLDSASQQR
jgi:hypothetical protein